MKTELTKHEKTTEIWFDEKETIIYIKTHNTNMKNRLKKYACRYSAQCRLTAEDIETGCMEFEIEKGRLSFRLTAPYTKERRAAASEYAKTHNPFSK